MSRKITAGVSRLPTKTFLASSWRVAQAPVFEFQGAQRSACERGALIVAFPTWKIRTYSGVTCSGGIMRGEMFTTRSTRKGWDSRSKLMLGCYMIGLLLAFPTRSMCADPPLCDLGATVVEQMNLQFTAGGRIDPVVLAGSIAFVKECPASLIPAFRQFADNEQNLHRSWIEALKSGAKIPANTELREFLAVAKRSVDHDGSALLKAYLDGVFEVRSGRLSPPLLRIRTASPQGKCRRSKQ